MFVISWFRDWDALSLSYDGQGGLFVMRETRSPFSVARQAPIGIAEIETLGL